MVEPMQKLPFGISIASSVMPPGKFAVMVFLDDLAGRGVVQRAALSVGPSTVPWICADDQLILNAANIRLIEITLPNLLGPMHAYLGYPELIWS